MTGYNHYPHCSCGWCVSLRGGGARRGFQAEIANARTLLAHSGYREGSYASCFVNPNARCPVCGAAVFFYANAHGSRVFFDELGPPWPKHGCTDHGRAYAIRTPARDYPPIQRRGRGEVDEIVRNLRVLSLDPRTPHREKYGADPTSVFCVEAVTRRGFANSVMAKEMVGGEGAVAFFRFDSSKFQPNAGDLCSTDGLTISFPELGGRKSGSFKVSVLTAEQFEAA